jgi:hypothetical protein
LERGFSSKQDTQEDPKKTEVLTQKVDTALSNPPGNQAKAQFETLIKKGQDTSPSTPIKPTTNTAGQQPSIEIGSLIMSLTPLQSSQGNPNAKVIFIEDLTLISAEEMPPSDFFFSKKRRVERETHQKDGAIVKRQRMFYDGQGLDDTDFAREMVGSLGVFATTNQCSVENLVEQLKQRNMLVRKLQDQMITMEKEVRNQMNKDLEQVRVSDRHQIQQLKTNLDELYQNSQANRELSTHQEDLIKKIQAKIDFSEVTTVEMKCNIPLWRTDKTYSLRTLARK